MHSRLFSGVLLFFALVAVYSLHSVSSRDPTSIFFDPRVGYAPQYSAVRREQAEAFIDTDSNHTALIEAKQSDGPHKLCVGIPSIARKGARYLRTSVGSLLEGLTPEERSEIYLVVFIPHSDPRVHPAFKEAWLTELADQVLVYNVSIEKMVYIMKMERDGGEYREKGLYDYNYLMKECFTKKTPYVAILEDDTLAMDGWYHRTMGAIEEAERLSAERKAAMDFLYLRMFYTEEFLGWNSEYWRTYLHHSVIIFGFPMSILLFLRISSVAGRRTITYRAMLSVAVGIVTCILLYFAIGRCTVLPLPPGVNEMPQFGCCSQGFVFPREKAISLVEYFEERKVGFVDVMTEEYADKNHELRWAMTPSVIQHVGRKSSKIDDYGPASKWGMSVAEKIWSFSFEGHNAAKLREEHRRVTQRT